MKIPPLEDRDRAWAEELVRENFSSSRVVSRSVLHQTERLPGIVAEDGTTPIGLLQYRIENNE